MKKEEKIVMKDEVKTHSWTLRKELLGFEVGMSYYSGFEKDEEDIVIPFSLSLYITSSKIVEQLPVYLECLRRNECPEVLGIDFDTMTSEAYWMKNYKLEHDMEALNSMPLRERDIEFAYKGFKPETTGELYEAIRHNVEQMVAMLKEVEAVLKAAPPVLYENFYRHLRAQYCEEQAVKDFGDWLMHSGKMSLCKLKSLRAKAIADYVNNGILRCCLKPSGEERSQVDIGAFRKQLPDGYPYEEWFDNCYAVFCRTVSWQGDILVPDYACAGLFIFQHWDQLTEKDIQAVFYLDKTLELIHGEMTALNQETAALPEELATPKARILLEKVRQAGYLDDNYQPLISNTMSALLANEIAVRLEIRNKWKAFERFWGRQNMYKDYYEAVYQKQCPDFQKSLYKVFD